MQGIKRWLTRTELKAVHREDLDAVLAEAGLTSAVEGRSLKCCSCGRVLSKDDIACLVRSPRGFGAICSDIECLSSVPGADRGTES